MIDICNAKHLDDESRKELAESYGISGDDYATKSALAGIVGSSFRKMYLAEKGYNVDLTDPVDYYKQNFGTRSIFRYIQTHPDLDHMRGLHRLHQEAIEILNFWDTDHTKSITEFKEDDEDQWKQYQIWRKSTDNPKSHFKFRGDNGSFWTADGSGGTGDGLHILAPTPELKSSANENEDYNAHSYVLWLQSGNYKVVLGGDATETVWQSIFEKYGKNLKCNILKAAHHGRDSGYYKEAVEAMSPEFTIVSVGKKPETDASNKYRQYSREVWSTRWKGTIVLTIGDDGKAVINSQY